MTTPPTTKSSEARPSGRASPFGREKVGSAARARPVKDHAIGSTSAARQSFSASPRRKFVIPHCMTQAMPFSAAKSQAIHGSPKA